MQQYLSSLKDLGKKPHYWDEINKEFEAEVHQLSAGEIRNV